jgi:hypothetical protein
VSAKSERIPPAGFPSCMLSPEEASCCPFFTRRWWVRTLAKLFRRVSLGIMEMATCNESVVLYTAGAAPTMPERFNPLLLDSLR